MNLKIRKKSKMQIITIICANTMNQLLHPFHGHKKNQS